MSDNEEFLKLYQWLISPNNDKLFEDVEQYLIAEKNFLNKKDFENTICQLSALQAKNISLKKDIRNLFMHNMYKFRDWQDIENFIQQEVSNTIKEFTVKHNILKSDIFALCDNEAYQETKIEMKALLLSYYYLFENADDVGAGDLAVGPYAPPLTRTAHTLLTNLYNDMTNGSLPVSVLQIPAFFSLPDKYFGLWYDGEPHEYFPFMPGSLNIIEFMNITHEALRNYHYLWHTYYYGNTNFTLYCEIYSDCSNALDFLLADIDKNLYIKKNLDLYYTVTGNSTSPPCSKSETVKKFKIETICNILTIISKNKELFLNLMKYTKQSPTFLEDVADEYSPFNQEFGFTFRDHP